MNELPIIQVTFDFQKKLLLRVLKFPRNLRHGLGSRIESLLSFIFENLLRAKFSPHGEKVGFLEAVNVDLELLRFQLRLAIDLQALPKDAAEHLFSQLFEIGSQVGGWLKSLLRKQDAA